MSDIKARGELEHIATELLKRQDLKLISCETVQSLWAGYGHICRVTALQVTTDHYNSNTRDSKPQAYVLKYIKPPSRKKARRIQTSDEGHLRKVLSYQIEQYFYTSLASQMPRSIGIASCVSNINSHVADTHITAMIMTDLKERYPVPGEKEAELSDTRTHTALQWLADFHGFWWTKTDELQRSALVATPLDHFANNQSTFLDKSSVWSNGGYTYLATRQTEYASLRSDTGSEWSLKLCSPISTGMQSIAEVVARFLSPNPKASSANLLGQHIPIIQSSYPYQTLLHGDVKRENMFTSIEGDAVAFYDFQYVGLGLGVCDLAKYFTCCVPLHLLLGNLDDLYEDSAVSMQSGEKDLLQEYLTEVCSISGKEYKWDVFVRHWETALVDWLRFQASWGFWGNSEWLEARSRSILADKDWIEWLKNATTGY